MNKKLLLGLGATLLPIVSLVAVVSCSSSDKVTIDTEVKKFDTSVKTTNKDLMASEAVISINNAADKTAKLNVLKTLVASLPSLDKAFDFEVKSAAADSTTMTTLNVSISVFEIEDKTNSKDATYKVTDFITVLDKEAKKFETSVDTKNKDIIPNDAVDSINVAIDPSAKLDALKALVDVPTLSAGYDFIIGSANVNSIINTTIDVSIEVFEVGTSNKKTVTFLITGFKIPSALDIETARFNISVPTIAPETSTTDAINYINVSATPAEKLVALESIANVPTASQGFRFEIKTASINPTSNTSVDVIITVIELVNDENSKDAIFTITGLTA
ncbi:MAG: hypothetical protein ACRCXE_01400 [Metamycoplasmataceae bacterium]